MLGPIPNLYLDKVPCAKGRIGAYRSYTGLADSMLLAYLPRKCRTAAACKYAVWNESAGNGLWGNPWFFYVWMGAVSICGTAPHFFTIAACLGAELCMWKESVWKKFRFGKRAIWPLKKRLPTQELGSISWESLRTARTAVSFYGSEPNAWSSVGYLTDISKKSSQFKHFDKIMCRIM